MRGHLFAVSILLPLAAAGTASAQDAGRALSVSQAGSLSCQQFSQLSPSQQNSIVRQITRSVPPPSLSTSVGRGQETTSSTSNNRNRSAVPGTPLTAGRLVNYCQMAPTNSTLREAYANANPAVPSAPATGP